MDADLPLSRRALNVDDYHRDDRSGLLEQKFTAALANAHGISLHAAVHCQTGQRGELERLCRDRLQPTHAPIALVNAPRNGRTLTGDEIT